MNEMFISIDVKYFNPGFTKAELDALFHPYGEMVSSLLHDDQSGWFGYVRYTTHASAVAAIEELHNMPGTWSPTRLHVTQVRTKKERGPCHVQEAERSPKDDVSVFILSCA